MSSRPARTAILVRGGVVDLLTALPTFADVLVAAGLIDPSPEQIPRRKTDRDRLRVRMFAVMRSMLSDQVSAELDSYGWLLVDYPDEEPLLELARRLGDPVPARAGAALPERLVPTHAANAAANSLSARYGFGAFPFHTDAAHHRDPPRILVMRSCGASADVADTRLINLHDAVGPLLSELRGGTWLVNAGRSRFYAPVVVRRGGVSTLRFDPGCMRAVSTRANEVERHLESIITTARGTPVRWIPAKALVVDNWRCLHGRAPVRDGERVLERVLVRAEGPT